MALIGDNESISRHLAQARKTVSRAQQTVENALNTFTSSTTTTRTTTRDSKPGKEPKKSVSQLREKLVNNWVEQKGTDRPEPEWIRKVYDALCKETAAAIENGSLTGNGYVMRDGRNRLTLHWSFKQISHHEIMLELQDFELHDGKWHEVMRDHLRDNFLADGFGVHIAHITKRQEDPPEQHFHLDAQPIWNVGEEARAPVGRHYMHYQFKLVL